MFVPLPIVFLIFLLGQADLQALNKSDLLDEYGTCQKGTSYTITGIEDLKARKDELECIYTAGTAPNTVPIGVSYGTVYQLANSPLLLQLTSFLWRGKVLFSTKCNSKPLYIGLNIINGKPRITAHLYLGVAKENLNLGEYDDRKPAFIIDYTEDFGSLCPSIPGALFNEDNISLNAFNNIYPFNQIVDVVRIVGRQPDGGLIYLGKTYARDFFTDNLRSSTIAFWSVVIYDENVTNFGPSGTPTQQVAETYTYRKPGLIDLTKIIVPRAYHDPILSATRFFDLIDSFRSVLIGDRRSDLARLWASATEHRSSHQPAADKLISHIATVVANDPVFNALTPLQLAQSFFVSRPDSNHELLKPNTTAPPPTDGSSDGWMIDAIKKSTPNLLLLRGISALTSKDLKSAKNQSSARRSSESIAQTELPLLTLLNGQTPSVRQILLMVDQLQKVLTIAEEEEAAALV